MPHRRRLVTYLTTCGVVPLAVLITLAFLAVDAGGETVRQGALQVSFGGSVAPSSLPRTGTTPVAVTIRGHVRALAGGPPPSLRRIAIEVNRVGVLDRAGLPTCPLGRLRASSTANALAACRGALVGEGRVSGVIVLPEQAPSPFGGRVVAFNGRLPGPGRVFRRHLSPGPGELRLRRRADGRRHVGPHLSRASLTSQMASIAKGFLSKWRRSGHDECRGT